MKISSSIFSSLQRVFADTLPKERLSENFVIAKNQRFSTQIACRLEDVFDDGVILPTAKLSVISGLENFSIKIRKVGLVPVKHRNLAVPESDSEDNCHYPGYVPDILYESNYATLRPLETQSFWLTIEPKSKITSNATIRLELSINGENHVIFDLGVAVIPIEIKCRKDFFCTTWLYSDALADYYKIDLFSDDYWRILENYFLNLVQHYQDTIYVPLFTPPLDGEKRNSQLLIVTPLANNDYKFDFSNVKQYIFLAKKCGFTQFEWCHLFSQWGAKYAPKIYFASGENVFSNNILGNSSEYQNFLLQLLAELHIFCLEYEILNKSIFHLSDEPRTEEHLQTYLENRQFLRLIAPWLKVADAFSENLPAIFKAIDLPIPNIAASKDFIAAKRDFAVYFCCGPRGKFLQRFLDTPLSKVAMSGFLFFRFGVKGFLHWGGNYWYQAHSQKLIDPFTVSDGNAPIELNWAHGDPFVIYPGEDGNALDSIRWEIFAEALQDYALLQTLGISIDDCRLDTLIAFDDFPFSSETINNLRREILLCH